MSTSVEVREFAKQLVILERRLSDAGLNKTAAHINQAVTSLGWEAAKQIELQGAKHNG